VLSALSFLFQLLNCIDVLLCLIALFVAQNKLMMTFLRTLLFSWSF